MRPEANAPLTPSGVVCHKLLMLSRGGSTASGCVTGANVIGSKANDSNTDTMANGKKPTESPTKMSHCPTAKAMKETNRYIENTRPRWSLGAKVLSQLSITMYKPTKQIPVTSRKPPQNHGLIHTA